MPRGGRRPGSGRKPKPGRVLRPGFGVPTPPREPLIETDALLEPPADLQAEEQAVWRALAPHALLERTLTTSRAPGFRVLCQQWVYCAQLDARIRLLGLTSREVDRLMVRLENWQKLLKASLGEFNLRSFGRPAAPEKPKSAAPNPWSQVTGKP